MLETSLDRIITKITVRLKEYSNNNYIGSGVLHFQDNFKDKVYVLTASHCLFVDGDTFKDIRNEICIDILKSDSTEYETIKVQVSRELLFTDITKDVAVLILDKKEVENIIGIIPKISPVKERSNYSNFITKGFPNATYGKELATLYPTWVHGIDNQFQLQLHEDYSKYSIEGFSGSPIYIIAEDEIYLYGIFTRFRPEEKGKVIYCQYIEIINELLNKQYLPSITFGYFGNYGLTSEFFSKHIQNSIKDLGPRFNEDLNFQLPIAKIFNDIAKDDYFFKRFLNIVDKWIVERGYRQLNDNIHLNKIETEYETVKQKTITWIKKLENSITQKINVEWLLESLEKLNDCIDDKSQEVYKLRREEEEKNKNVKQDHTYRTPYEQETSRLREIKQCNNDFINDLSNKINVNLANNPYLIIKGDAGNGKSHLLGDIAKTRLKRSLPTVLLLGQQFNNSKDIWENTKSNLSVNCTNKQLLATLNNIGKQVGSRVLLLVDAINEGAGADLWNSRIASFINEFSNYPFLGLVLTIRTTYLDFVIPENVRKDAKITFKTHEGFKGNEYAALKLFCEFHGLKQPNFPILAPEFTKPLFLQLICDTIKDTPEKTFPQGFQGVSSIFQVYIDSINRKFQNKRDEYKYCNVVLDAIHKVAFANYNNENNSLLLKDVRQLLKTEFPDHKLLLNDLIEESIFITNPQTNYKTNQQEEVIYFAYQRFGDFYIAENLLKNFSNSDDVINSFKKENKFGKLISDRNGYWYNEGILEAFSILLPEKFKLEIFEVYNWYFENDEIDKFHKSHIIEVLNSFLLDSLNWRKIESIDNEKLVNWFRGEYFRVSDDDYFYKLIELSTIKGHPFNSDRLFRILKSYKMPVRDSFWQQHLRYFSSYDDNENGYPIRRLIDWAWTPDISNKLDSETTRLTAQTLTWILSSTNIKLRDQTTKAMVNLLEQQPDALISILKVFKNIDDLYISERLYAIAYGCVLRTENVDSINKIALVIYNYIFKKGIPPNHILLRDYARNTIEYALYKNPKLKIDISLIRPPFKSKLPNRLPSKEEVLKYSVPYDDPKSKKDYRLTNNRIYHSVTGYGDFSKHIDGCLDDFAPTSFTFEIEYNSFYKSLNNSKKKFLRTIIEILKTKASINKNKSLFTYKYGEDKHKSQLKSIDDFLNKMLNFIDDIFDSNEKLYLLEKVIPFLEAKYISADWKLNKSDINSFKYWIIDRVFKLGFNAKIHGQYDDSISRYTSRSENTIERIGKKYQRIAFFEILAMISDNYKLNKFSWSSDKKYEFFKGPWQIYIRDIDPAFTLKNPEENEEKDDLGILSEKKEWWEDLDYKYWNQTNSEWIEKLDDLPIVKDILEKNDSKNNESWLFLKKFVSWNEPKPIGEDKYDVQHKEIFYKIQGYLINKKDKNKILNWLVYQNFWGNWMPESSDYSKLINREKFWSPAYLDSDKENKWEIIRDTNFKLIIASSNAVGEMSDDKSDAHFSYDMPCETIFKGMNLQYAPIDGQFKNELNEIIVTNKNYKGLMIKKKEFLKFLDVNNLDIIWTVLGEKMSYQSSRHTNFHKELSGVYYFENGIIKGQIKSFEEESF
ncbi:AVAST type 2 anti-phage system protein Avs2 [Flavobacterium sp. LS1P3]|uniref:AVAST type 2 anti-phage system protein Avs2 n=1 Tax=Flavobacterium sp. LS1P3 TaxID=3401720 RepID=UPI003AAE76EF